MVSIVGWMIVLGDHQCHHDCFTLTDPTGGLYIYTNCIGALFGYEGGG